MEENQLTNTNHILFSPKYKRILTIVILESFSRFYLLRLFAKNAGCAGDLKELRGCLKTKEPMDIINAGLGIPNFAPVIDGDFLHGRSLSMIYFRLKFPT